MSGVVVFESEHGPIAIEVEDSALPKDGLPPTGYVPATKGWTGETVVEAPEKFEKAMASLKAYAASLNDIVGDLELTPKEVSVQVGLKLKGALGFVIARADAESDVRVTLKWEPRSKTEAAA